MNKNKLICTFVSAAIAAGTVSALPAAATDNPFAWTFAYSNLISDMPSNTNFEYNVVMLDDDNIPELIVYDPDRVNSGGVYTCKDNKAVCLAVIDSGQGFEGFVENSGLFCINQYDTIDTEELYSYTTKLIVYNFENGIASTEAVFEENYTYSETTSTSTSTQKINGTETEYDEFYNKRSYYTGNYSETTMLDYEEVFALLSGIIRLDSHDTETIDFNFTPDGTLYISGTGVLPEYEWSGLGYGGYDIEAEWYDDQTPPWYSFRTLVKKIVISEGITAIEDNTFLGCIKLESVSLPSTIEKIGNYAFMYCTSLKNIHIPEKASYIASEAFAYCRSFKMVEIPESVTAIYYSSFDRNASLEYFVINNPECAISDGYDTISNIFLSSSSTEPRYLGTIIGHAGSTAQAYAEKYGCKFRAIDSLIFGDVNFDDSVTAADAATALAGYAAYAATGIPTLIPLQEKLADATGDGSATAADAAKILSYYAYTATATGQSLTFEQFLAQ